MSIPTVTFGVTPPALGDDEATFNANMDATLNRFPGYTTELNGLGAAMGDAVAAAIAAATATTLGTSTSSVAVGTGSKSFVTQSGKNWAVGSWLSIASAANPSTQYMGGIVTAYSGTALTVVVPTGSAIGSGTFADWSIALSGQALTTIPFANAADVRAGTDAVKALTTKAVMDAAASVALTDAATITPDFSAGMNFHVTLGGNRTLANPINQIAGQSGRFRITQDATGSRTLSFGSNWKFPGGAPALSTIANSVDVFGYFVHANGTIEASLIKALS